MQFFVPNKIILCSKQNGLNHRVSSEQLILRVLDTLYQALDTKKHKYIAILSLDIRKAFDTVNHHLLVSKHLTL